MPLVELPSALRPLCGGKARVTVPGATVGAVLEALCLQAPALRERLFASPGTLKRTIGVFLDEEDVREQGGLQASVGAGQTLLLVAAVAGG